MNKGPKVRKYDKLSLMTGSLLQRAYTWLEPDEGKLSCPVLRGGSVSNDALLPDYMLLPMLLHAKHGRDFSHSLHAPKSSKLHGKLHFS